MNVNASIVDQRVRALAESLRTNLPGRPDIVNDEARLRSLAFVFLVMRTVLDLNEEEALETLTDGGNDFGVDALHVTAPRDGEFGVTIVQAKYSSKKLEGESAFPENDVLKVIRAVQTLFDPDKVVTLRSPLRARVEEVRSMVRDGLLPQVRILLANNGKTWTKEAQQQIDAAALGSQVRWEHVNHDRLVSILGASKPVDETLHLTGRALVEDFEFRRVLLGRVTVAELARVFEAHGDLLLERNIRRYLGLHGNRVNEAIANTLRDSGEQPNFYFYNNGVTILCSQFRHNALQAENWPVRISGMRVINGGQTCKTIQEVLRSPPLGHERATVLVRLYELPADDAALVRSITYATNSQNPVDLRDLRSNDDRQRVLELGVEGLGYRYLRQRGDEAAHASDIASDVAADAVLSVWRERPHQARFMSGEHFGRLYDLIFTPGLNAAQLVSAVLLLRIAENQRKRPQPDAPDFLPYASRFAAMLMGRYLLSDMGGPLQGLTHATFPMAEKHIAERGEQYFTRALQQLTGAIQRLYGSQPVSLQRLSATFRRGDLVEILNEDTSAST